MGISPLDIRAKIYGLVEQPGVLGSLSRSRSRVQISSGPPSFSTRVLRRFCKDDVVLTLVGNAWKTT